MKIVVPGGTGFIGKPLISHWLESGHNISVISRNRNKVKRIFKNTVKAFAWNDLNGEAHDEIANADLVINLAGAFVGGQRWNEKFKKELYESRIDTTRKIVDVCKQYGTQGPTLFNSSAITIYGIQPNTPEMGESFDEYTPIDYQNPPDYFLAYMVRDWERATWEARDAGTRVVNLRFGIVLDKTGGPLKQMSLPFRLCLGGKLGKGNHVMPWISLTDTISAINYIWQETDFSGPINLVSPHCVQQKHFAKSLCQALNRPSLFPPPVFLLKLVYGQLAKDLMLSGQHVSPTRLKELNFNFQHQNIENALKDIYHL